MNAAQRFHILSLASILGKACGRCLFPHDLPCALFGNSMVHPRREALPCIGITYTTARDGIRHAHILDQRIHAISQGHTMQYKIITGKRRGIDRKKRGLGCLLLRCFPMRLRYGLLRRSLGRCRKSRFTHVLLCCFASCKAENTEQECQ